MLSIGSILLFFYFSFTTLSGFIAAPFNGLLAEKSRKILTGEAVNDDGFAEIMKDVPRMLNREWQKLWYSLPKFVGLVLIEFYPSYRTNYYSSTNLPIYLLDDGDSGTVTTRLITIKFLLAL